MKRISILCISLLVTILATAQEVTRQLNTSVKHQFLNFNSDFATQLESRTQALYKTSSPKMRLDSMIDVGTNPRKVLYLYDNMGRILDESEYHYIAGIWRAKFRTIFFYDTLGRLTVTIDSRGSTIDPQIWLVKYRRIRSYNSDNTLNELLEEYWLDNSQSWNHQFLTEMTYNSTNLLTTVTKSWWNNNQWNNDALGEYSYNAQNELIATIWKDWDAGQWKKLDKIEYSYTMAGKPQQTTRSYWDNLNWIPGNRTTYTYNSQGNTDKILEEFYSAMNSAWMNVEKEEFSYTSFGSIDVSYKYTYDTITNGWVYDSKLELESDQNYTYNDLILPFLEANDKALFAFKADRASWFYYEFGNWILDQDYYLYYSPYSMFDVPENEANKVMVYPNPATDWLAVEIDKTTEQSTFELFDFGGRLLLKTSFNERTRLNIGDLKSGFYFWKLTNNEEASIENGILVKQ